MGLQAHNGRHVRLQQAGRPYADVLQLPGAAVRTRRPRQDGCSDEPYTVHQVCMRLYNYIKKNNTIVVFSFCMLIYSKGI